LLNVTVTVTVDSCPTVLGTCLNIGQGSTRLSMGARRQAMVREAARSVMSSCGSACPVNA